MSDSMRDEEGPADPATPTDDSPTQGRQTADVQRLTKCIAVHIYDSRGVDRLVIAQQPDPRVLKITVSARDEKGTGFKSTSIDLDRGGFEALRDAFTGYDSPFTLLAPISSTLVDVAELNRLNRALAREVQEMRRANQLKADSGMIVLSPVKPYQGPSVNVLPPGAGLIGNGAGGGGLPTLTGRRGYESDERESAAEESSL